MKIDNLDLLNRRALDRISKFRENYHSRLESYEDFSKIKHQFPYFGYVSCKASDIEFLLFHANDDVVAWEYLWFGADAYEREILGVWLDWCRSAVVVYDIGAYTGLMSVLAALANSGSRVHLFEPMERTIERAKINIKSNLVEGQVKLHNRAASNVCGNEVIKLYRNEDFLGTGNSIYDKSLKVFDEKVIRCVTIDDHLKGVRPDVVKIDVEGHELACLHGMEKTLKESRPKMIVEMWEHSRKEVLAYLSGLGYECSPFEKNEKRVMNFKCVPV